MREEDVVQATPGRVALLGQVEEVRISLFYSVTTLEGLDMLLELLSANGYAATAARVRVEGLGVPPSAPTVYGKFRLLREHLQG